MLEERFMTIEQMHEYIAQFLEVLRLELEVKQSIESRLADIGVSLANIADFVSNK